MAKNKDKEAPALMPEDQSFQIATEEVDEQEEVLETPEEKDPEVDSEPAVLPEEMDPEAPEAVFQETPVVEPPAPVESDPPPVPPEQDSKNDKEDDEEKEERFRLRAKVDFKTSFRGVMLSFKSGDVIDDPELGQFMLDTNAESVHWVEETAQYIECPKCKHSFVKAEK